MSDVEHHETILEEAHRAVHGERQRDYGHPYLNHTCTASMWNAYLTRRFGITGVYLTPRDVCLLNALQKISRDANFPKRDNLVDLAGYAENAHICQDAETLEKEPTCPLPPGAPSATPPWSKSEAISTALDAVSPSSPAAKASSVTPTRPSFGHLRCNHE